MWVKILPRDPISGLTHFIGVILAIWGSQLLLDSAVDPWKPWHLATYFVFCFGMIIMFTTSTILHWWPASASGVERLRRFDHLAIYIMIAGTYTPICLIPLREDGGWGLFLGIWSFAALGFIFKYYWFHAPEWLSTVIYLMMGWLGIMGALPILRELQFGAIVCLVGGGLFYSYGAIIFMRKHPDPWPGIFGHHELWHIFVMLGCLSHFWLMYHYINQFN